jgi:hypothetical protein
MRLTNTDKTEETKCDNNCVGFEVVTAVDMNAVIFWDKAPFSPYVKRRFSGMYHLHLQGRKSTEQETSL